MVKQQPQAILDEKLIHGVRLRRRIRTPMNHAAINAATPATANPLT